MAKIEGGYLCGAVRYRAETEPVLIAACHCAACQRRTGSAFSVNVALRADSVTVEGDALATYEDRSGASGSPILGRGAAYEGLAFRKAGTLDDPSWATPGAQIRCDEKQPWVVIPGDAQCFDGNRE